MINKKDTADYHRLTTRINELEDENHQYYRDVLNLNNKREQLEQAIRALCIEIVSGSILAFGEERVARCETMDILELISFARQALNQQMQEWVDRSMELINRINYLEKNE